MRTLQPSHTKNGFTYYLVARNDKAAIFAQYDGNRFVSYEVGKVKNVKESTIKGNTIEAGESFWSNEDFGVIAWAIHDLIRAVERYHEITNEPARQ